MTMAIVCRALLAACLSLPITPSFAAADATSDSIDRYDTTVVIDARGTDALQRVRLPLEVLRRSRTEGFADLRVVDARGQVLPMAWVHTAPPWLPRVDTVALPYVAWPKDRPAPTGGPQTQIEWTSDGSTLRIRREASGAMTVDTPSPPKADAAPTWLVDLQPLGERRANALSLDWSPAEHGLVRAVRVAASRDAQQWHDVGRATLVEWQAGPIALGRCCAAGAAAAGRARSAARRHALAARAGRRLARVDRPHSRGSTSGTRRQRAGRSVRQRAFSDPPRRLRPGCSACAAAH